jgi:hypothetical protein
MSTQRRKLLPTIIAVTVVVLSVIAVSGLIFVHQVEQSVATFGRCSPSVQERMESPDRNYVAIVFSMECNATVGFNTQLSIARRDEAFSPKQHRAILILAGHHQLEPSWTDGNALIVRVPAGITTFRKEQPEINVQVQYQ